MKINSGIAVPIANNDGRIKPYELDITTGTSVTKNKINIVGQKAEEKLHPNINNPNGVSSLHSFDS
jgi:hypothetical protein